MNNIKSVSNLMKKLNEGEFVYTGELEPPRSVYLTKLLNQAIKIKEFLTAVNITDNPGSNVSINSLTASIYIQEKLGFETIFQITCRDMNRMGLASSMLSAASRGIKNILVLTGDHTTLGNLPNSKPVFDLDSTQLLELAREMVDKKSIYGIPIKNSENFPPKFHIGIGANPNTTHPNIELLKIEKKINLGAEFIQTQVIYDLNKTESFLGELKKFKIPALIGIFPLQNYQIAKNFDKNVPGVNIPKEILKNLKEIDQNFIHSYEKDKEYDKINLELFQPIIEYVRKQNLNGIHITAQNYNRIYPKLKNL